MKALLLALTIFSFNAHAQNYHAKHCEIFIDRVATLSGNQHSSIILFYIKTLNARLDSAIEEVGFRQQSKSLYAGSMSISNWKNDLAKNYKYSSDYFTLAYTTSHDFGSTEYVGSFYVKTIKGTYYWLKTAEGDNFEINKGTFNKIVSFQGRRTNSLDPDQAAPTQYNELSYFNHSNCY